MADSLPTIKASDLNSIQAYFNHLWNATRSLKKIIIDGTGDAVTTAPGGDDDPTLVQTATIAGTRKLVTHINVGTYKARLYKAADAFEIVVNAVWSPGGAVWDYDSATKATRLVIERDYLRWERYAGATGWADAAWVSGLTWTSGVDLISSLAMRSTAALSGTSEPTTTPVATGAIYRDNVCHGWARGVYSGATTFDFTRGINITSFDRIGVGQFRVTFARAADNHLIPSVQVCSAGCSAWTVPPSTITTSAFDIYTFDMAGVAAELAVGDIIVASAYQG